MKWKTHKAISKAISEALNLPKNLEKSFVEGSIWPDKYPERSLIEGKRKYYTSHHNPETEIIMKHIWKARLTYLKRGDNFLTMRSIERAVHYIQDKSVSKGFLGLAHNSREKDVSLQPIPKDAIQKGINIAICSPDFIRKCIKATKPKGDPEEALYQASMYSAAITKAVTKDKVPSSELINNFKFAKERYYKKTIPMAIGVGIIVFSIIFIVYIYRLYYISLIVTSMQYFGVALIAIFFGYLAGCIIEKLDFKYYSLKEEMKWFGKY